MDIYMLLKRRLRGKRYVYPSEFNRKVGSLGFTKVEIGRLVKQLEMTGKLKRSTHWFELILDE